MWLWYCKADKDGCLFEIVFRERRDGVYILNSDGSIVACRMVPTHFEQA